MAKDGVKTNGFNKEKVRGFLKEVDKIDDWAASEHGKISNKTKERLGNVREHAESIGIQPRVMNAVIKEHRLRRKADGIRDDFADNIGQDDSAIVDQLDNVRLAAQLPLFGDPEDKPAKKPEKKAEPKKTESTVVELAKAAGASPSSGLKH